MPTGLEAYWDFSKAISSTKIIDRGPHQKQGTFHGSYYQVNPEARNNPETAWIFEGIEDEKLGDFGYSGNGAAGFELDRADHRLGSPEDIHILASSEGHDDTFVLVPEELLTHLTTWPGGH